MFVLIACGIGTSNAYILKFVKTIVLHNITGFSHWPNRCRGFCKRQDDVFSFYFKNGLDQTP